MRFSEWEKEANRPDGWRCLGEQAAGKDKNAFKYLLQMAYCIRTIDDFYDQDEPISNEDVIDVFKLLSSVVPSNLSIKIILKHYSLFYPLAGRLGNVLIICVN